MQLKNRCDYPALLNYNSPFLSNLYAYINGIVFFPGCENGWLELESHCYVLDTIKTTWVDIDANILFTSE